MVYIMNRRTMTGIQDKCPESKVDAVERSCYTSTVQTQKSQKPASPVQKYKGAFL